MKKYKNKKSLKHQITQQFQCTRKKTRTTHWHISNPSVFTLSSSLAEHKFKLQLEVTFLF